MTDIRRDLTRTTLAVLCILVLLASTFWVLLPFLAAGVWATMIVVATWPLLLALQRRFKGRRGLAAALMTLGLVMLLVVPLTLAVGTIADHAQDVVGLVQGLRETGLPQAPSAVLAIPVVGGKLALWWNQIADAGPQGLLTHAMPYAKQAGQWAVTQVGGLGFMLLQFMMVVVIAAVLYVQGEAAATLARRCGQRIAGMQGEGAVVLAGQAIRGVALGVGVTAMVQALLAGIGLAVAGVPFASLLSALALMFCIAQIGPALVLFPAVGWMYWSGDTGWATALLVWSLFVSTMDNFLRPMLIRKGADLPLLLIFAGVIGGMFSMGLIGIFVGPVLLAVAYKLLQAWLADALDHPPQSPVPLANQAPLETQAPHASQAALPNAAPPSQPLPPPQP
jgi:predicted PurR-regulated permease PerM